MNALLLACLVERTKEINPIFSGREKDRKKLSECLCRVSQPVLCIVRPTMKLIGGKPGFQRKLCFVNTSWRAIFIASPLSLLPILYGINTTMSGDFFLQIPIQTFESAQKTEINRSTIWHASGRNAFLKWNNIIYIKK